RTERAAGSHRGRGRDPAATATAAGRGGDAGLRGAEGTASGRRARGRSWSDVPMSSRGIDRAARDRPSAGHAQAVRTTTRPRRRGLVISASIVLAALGAWQLATAALHLEAWVLPTPVEVAAAFTQPDTQALIVDNLWPTVEEAAVGF